MCVCVYVYVCVCVYMCMICFLVTAEGEVEFDVLNVLDFDSTRKRMSIIVRHPLSKEIILFVKGADSAILSVLHKNYKGLLVFNVFLGCVWHGVWAAQTEHI